MKFENIIQLTQHFSDERVCRQHLENLRWEDGKPVCPHCGHEKVYTIEGGKRYKCVEKNCRQKFSATVGTIFENSKIQLRTWFIAIYLCCNHKKGVSSLQLSRDLGVTQKTAWFVLHRVREMLGAKAPKMLTGDVEIDETYVGGLSKNKHLNKRTKNNQGRSTKDKSPVLGILERGGCVVTHVVSDTKSATVQPIMRSHVQIGATIHTDEYRSYRGLNDTYNHSVVRHGHGEYVVGNAHTNSLEGFWSHLKLGVIGVYHQVSPKHLHRYCDAFSFRYNTREISQQERLNRAISQSDGRRLTYSKFIEKQA